MPPGHAIPAAWVARQDGMRFYEIYAGYWDKLTHGQDVHGNHPLSVGIAKASTPKGVLAYALMKFGRKQKKCHLPMANDTFKAIYCVPQRRNSDTDGSIIAKFSRTVN